MAVTSIGTVFNYGDGGGPEVFTALGEVTGVSHDGGSTNFDDITDLSDIWVERLATNIDPGTVTVDVIYDSDATGIKALRADWTARTLRNFQIVYSDTSQEDLTGYIVSMPRESAVGRAVRGSLTIQLTGAPTFTDGV